MKLVKILLTTLLSFASFGTVVSKADPYTPYQPTPEEYNVFAMDRFAYCPNEKITKFDCENCDHTKTLVGTFEAPSKSSSQVIIVGSPDMITVTFRGTINKIQQWASDLDADLTPWFLGKVHDGFHQRFNELSVYSYRTLQNARDLYPHAEIYISGHSMGGALAVLFSSYIKAKGNKSLYPEMVYTFGAPRIGDAMFARYITQQLGTTLIRFMNENDAVPDMPMKSLGYKHAGVLVICKTGTTNCKMGKLLEENAGGPIGEISRIFQTSKNVAQSHLTYLNKPIGTNKYICG
jgi:hypothetical protein